MPTTFTKESRPTTTFTREPKPGLDLIHYLTWDEETDTWNDVPYTWDTATSIEPATAFTKETKPTTSFTDESKPSTSFTKQTNPSTSFTKETKP